MSEKLLTRIVEESIKLELNVGELYKLFNSLFPEDAYFWWKLSEEEKNHAELIRKMGGIEFLTSEILKEMLPSTLDVIKDTNKKISSHINKYKSKAPSREEAFNFALKIENSACEIHYQKFMNLDVDDLLTITFQKLNNSDKDHYKRLVAYMNEHGIPVL